MGLSQSQLRRHERKRQNHHSDVHYAQDSTLELTPDPEADLPDHWKFEFKSAPGWPPFLRQILKLCMKGLCLVSLGHSDVRSVWQICASDDGASWVESTARLYDRLNTIVVVVSRLSLRPALLRC